MFSCIFLSVWPWKVGLSLFIAGPKNKLEATRFLRKRCTYLAEIAEENYRTTSFWEIGLFIYRHVYLGKQLLPKLSNCC